MLQNIDTGQQIEYIQKAEHERGDVCNSYGSRLPRSVVRPSLPRPLGVGHMVGGQPGSVPSPGAGHRRWMNRSRFGLVISDTSAFAAQHSCAGGAVVR